MRAKLFHHFRTKGPFMGTSSVQIAAYRQLWGPYNDSSSSAVSSESSDEKEDHEYLLAKFADLKSGFSIARSPALCYAPVLATWVAIMTRTSILSFQDGHCAHIAITNKTRSTWRTILARSLGLRLSSRRRTIKLYQLPRYSRSRHYTDDRGSNYYYASKHDL